MTGQARTRKPRPVVVPAGAEILLEIRHEKIAHTGLFHLPSVEADAEARVFDDLPTRTRCGLTGETFALGGELLDLRLCKVCEERAPASMRQKPQREPKPRGKPRWKHSRIKPAHLQVLYRLYVDEKMSCRALAELVYERLGYKTAKSCSMSLYRAFRAAGYELRSQPEATVLRNFKHGRRPRSVDAGPENAAYRRWLKRELGRYRPQCAAVKSQQPRKGERCSQPAMGGSEFCFNHDPARREERDAICARMRSRQPRWEYVPFAPVLDQLGPLLDGVAHPATVLHRATGVPHGTCSRLLTHRPERITVELADRLLAPVEERIAA